MAHDPSKSECEFRNLRLAWRYLAAIGVAPLAPADPIAHALACLIEEAEAEWRQARQDLGAAIAVAAAAAVLFIGLLASRETSLLAQIALRAAIAIAVTCALNDGAEAAKRWFHAWRLSRAARAGLVEETFMRAFATGWSRCPDADSLGRSKRQVH